MSISPIGSGILGGGGGSVAASDITDAGAVGVDLVQAATAAEASAVLVPPTRTTVANTGWTTAVTGSASASHAAGVHTLNVDSNSAVFTYLPAVVVPEAPELELIGRILVTTGAPGSAWWTVLSLGNAADNNVVIAQPIETGQVQFWTMVAGSGTLHATSPGSISLTSGDDYVRLVVYPSYVAAYYGTGSGATAPTSWTLVGSVATPVALLAGGYLTQVGLRSGRTASGSGTYTTEWRNVQTRALGLVT